MSYITRLILGLLVVGVGTVSCQRDMGVVWDSLVLPGQRVGPITAELAPEDVIAVAAGDSVRWDSIAVLDASYDIERYDSVLVVYPAGGQRELRVVFADTEGRRRAARVLLGTESGMWRTEEGLGVGVDLQTIERMNGRPFRLSTYGADLPPRILSWNGGNFERYDRKLIVRFDSALSANMNETPIP